MTGRRNHGGSYRCPNCRRLLAYVRREMIVLRRLLITADAVATERDGDTVTLTCTCGQRLQIDWRLIQR
jgi:hypothetical protein